MRLSDYDEYFNTTVSRERTCEREMVKGKVAATAAANQ